MRKYSLILIAIPVLIMLCSIFGCHVYGGRHYDPPRRTAYVRHIYPHPITVHRTYVSRRRSRHQHYVQRDWNNHAGNRAHSRQTRAHDSRQIRRSRQHKKGPGKR